MAHLVRLFHFISRLADWKLVGPCLPDFAPAKSVEQCCVPQSESFLGSLPSSGVAMPSAKGARQFARWPLHFASANLPVRFRALFCGLRDDKVEGSDKRNSAPSAPRTR